MCGISAFLLHDSNIHKNWYCFETLIKSLKALQNRGYDSCGIIDNNFTSLLKAVNKPETINTIENIPKDAVEHLELQKNKFPKNAYCGIAHTRWATSGKKTIENAHPHISFDNKIAVVHNGIIENYIEIKEELKKKGCTFKSETDTEVISNWISYKISQIHSENITEKNIINILKDANIFLKGTWAITVIYKNLPDYIFVSRRGNPLLIGFHTLYKTIMVSSEIAGFVNMVDKYTCLNDNTVIYLKRGFSLDDIIKQSNLVFQDVPKEIIEITPGDFPYFMAKEIYDQIKAIYGPCEWGKYKNLLIKDIPELKKLYNIRKNALSSNNFEGFDVLLIGCGTSYNSCLSSKYFFDSYPFRTVKCIVASEFTEYDIPNKGLYNNKNTIAILLSQSGETLDTYRALQIIKKYDISTISLVNVQNSLISRECDYSLYLHAGREVGVASTKAYVTQIICLHLLSLYLKKNNEITIPDDYFILSSQIEKTLKKHFPYFEKAKNNKHMFICQKPFFNIITSLHNSNHGFILSSGSLCASSREGSLKIKEIGRIFIEGYPTASLKHGPFSLIEDGVPIIFILQKGEEGVLRKTTSAIEEVYLRGATIYVITDIEKYKNNKVHEIIKVPYNKTFSSILHIIPFQIISYFLSDIRNLNCDKPLNLAKCVTTD